MSEDQRKGHDSKSSEEISSKLPVQKHSIKHKVTEKTNHEQSFWKVSISCCAHLINM